MDFIVVDEVPEQSKRCGRKGILKTKLDKFMDMHTKSAKVVWHEHKYTCPASCYNSFKLAAKRYVYPIDVVMRNGEVYLIRRDM